MGEQNNSKRPPVLLATMSLGLGGAETHVVSLATGLKRRGWQVIVASAGGYQVRELDRELIPHVQIPLDSRSILKMRKSLVRLSDLVQRERIGLIHAHARIPGVLSRVVARKCGIPLVMTYHFPFKSGFPWRFFSPPGDVTIAVSEDIRRYIDREFGIPAESTVVIPNGIDTTIFRPPSAEEVEASRNLFGLSPADGPVFSYASRLTPELAEAAVATIQAVSILAKGIPGITLLVAGDGSHLPVVETEAAKINSSLRRKAVHVLGLVENMPPVYWVSSLVVGMSRVALEAMACAKPVIVAGPGGVTGLVENKTLPFLALRNFTSRDAPEALSAPSIAAYVQMVLNDPARAEGLGRYGRDLVARSYSVDSMVAQTEHVYENLLRACHFSR
ncbi:MAG TPA: glycosyltransferase family 4 protein [Firmicutes bacterium]|nr:glycosyltransferase family 4 protein [Candidatus Fermentithermobacillaceae bacterium]